MPDLEHEEATVKATTSAKHKDELALVVKLLNVYIEGFSDLGSFTRNDKNDVEYAWLLITTRSFNSLRSAHILLPIGYYDQAIMLARSVQEDWLVATDCESNEATLKGILEDGDTFWRGELSFAKMAERHGFKETWEHNYGALSEIAHPRKRALDILVDPDTRMLRFGGQYDEVLFLGICDVIVQDAVIMSEFPNRLLTQMPPAGQKSWHSRNLAVIQEAVEWRRSLKEKFPEVEE